jgi:hypothetical protein
MKKILLIVAVAFGLVAGGATAAPVAKPLPSSICGYCDGGSLLPPCTSALAGYYGYIVYSSSPTKSWFICDGRGHWIYQGEVPR